MSQADSSMKLTGEYLKPMPIKNPNIKSITMLPLVLIGGCILLTRAAYSLSPNEKPIICIDPGHPSETSAGASDNGLVERHINWLVALQLRSLLTKQGVKCVMTKSNEMEFVTNRRRAEIANKAHALLFIRLHCDAAGGNGFTLYYPSHSGRKYGVTGPPPAVCHESEKAAHLLDGVLKVKLQGYLHANPVRTDDSTYVGSHQGGVLTGSIFARVPTVLVEMCDLTSHHDDKFIATNAGRERVATALDQAIERYLEFQMLHARNARSKGI